MLYVSALGGLGNRLRVIDSVVALAATSRRRAVVLWHLDQTLGTQAENIFDPTALAREGVTLRSERRHSPRRLLRSAAVSLLPIRVWHQAKVQQARMSPSKGVAEFLALRHAHLRTGHRFFDNPQPYAWLQWRPAITETLPTMKRPALGLHLRGTDRRSPHTEATLRALLALAESHLGQKRFESVFIASDKGELAERARLHLGAQAITLPNLQRDRSRAEAGIDAGRDLLALAGCQMLLTNTTSSYARLAAQLGETPLANLAQLAGLEKNDAESSPLL